MFSRRRQQIDGFARGRILLEACNERHHIALPERRPIHSIKRLSDIEGFSARYGQIVLPSHAANNQSEGKGFRATAKIDFVRRPKSGSSNGSSAGRS